jgi:hypothetical protein
MTVAVDVDVPEIKAGVSMPLQAHISLLHSGGRKPPAEEILDFTVYSRDPFAHREKWLQDLNPALYDPIGKTARLFREEELPVKTLKSLDSCRGHKGLIIVGEGLGGRDQANICRALLEMAASGSSILCLAPTSARFPLDMGDPPMSLAFHRADRIRQLDKDLDTTVWSGGRNPIAATCQITGLRGEIFAEFATGPSGWSWFEAEDVNGGRCLVVGFPIVEAWQEAPSPRVLFVRLLEYLSESK